MRVTVWVVAAAVILGAVNTRAAEEPTYKGRTASEWAKLLADRDDATRLQAMTAVLAIGKDGGVDAAKISPLLDDSDVRIRAKAASWLALVNRDPKSLDVATRILERNPAKNNHDPIVCADALDAIGRHGWAARALLPALQKRLDYYERTDTPEDGPIGREIRSLRTAIKLIREAQPKQP
jgi:hypothetical protein